MLNKGSTASVGRRVRPGIIASTPGPSAPSISGIRYACASLKLRAKLVRLSSTAERNARRPKLDGARLDVRQAEPLTEVRRVGRRQISFDQGQRALAARRTGDELQLALEPPVAALEHERRPTLT